MTPEQVLLLLVQLEPAVLTVVDDMIHAIRAARADGQTEQQAVAAARQVAREVVDLAARAAGG